MSLPRSDKPPNEEPRADSQSTEQGGAPEDAEREETWWDRVEPWRRLMLGGAILLLLASAVQAWLKDDLPDAALFAANFGGYLLLALGFAQFFRDRRKR